MIERKCETCDLHKFHCYLTDCREPERGHWIPSRAALEARIEALEDVARKLAAEATRVINDVIAKGVEARTERDAYRASVARLESERAGLRHSLAEVESERDEAVSAMEEWRARAEVAEPERERLRDGLRWALEFIARCRWDEDGEIPHRDLEMLARLRALLGEAKGGGAS